MRKQSPVRHAGIAKKPLDPIEERRQPFRIKPSREIVTGKARAQPVIVLPLKRAFRLRPLRQNAKIILIYKSPEDDTKDDDRIEQRLQGAFRKKSEPSDDWPKRTADFLSPRSQPPDHSSPSPPARLANVQNNWLSM
jgi:hypothetical protein